MLILLVLVVDTVLILVLVSWFLHWGFLVWFRVL